MHDEDNLIQKAHSEDFSRKRGLSALFVGLASLILYMLTLARLPLPGDSVNNLLILLRLSPVESFRNPLWFWMGRLVLRVTSGAPLFWIHGMNALMGAACAGLLFWIMADIPHNRTSEEKIRNVRPLWPQFVSGFTAAALLAFCAPFWFASVRAFPQTLHVLLVLLLVLLLLVYRESGRFRWIVGFAVLYGISLVESALLFLFSPLFLAACLVLLWHHEHLQLRRLALLVMAFLGGLSVILLHAWSFMGTPTYALREFRSYGHLLGVMLKDHYLLAMRGVPRVGWLMIGLFSVLPWLLIVPFPRGGDTKKKGFWGSYLLVLILTIFGMVILANYAISPWAQFGLMPLVVLPYLLLASWMGYLAGYGYIMAARPRRPGVRTRSDRPYLPRRMYLSALTAGVLVLAVRNYHDVSDRQAAPAMGLARDVVASLEGREWLVTNGAIDGLIQYAAFEAGVSLNLLNLGLAQAPLHKKSVASMMPNPRLRSLALVGIGPLLEEWIGSGEEGLGEVAVLAHPDIWQNAGHLAVPVGVIFLGTPASSPPSAPYLLEMGRRHLIGQVGQMDAAMDAIHPLPAINEWVFSHYSKVANNLGVFMEDQGLEEEALEYYLTALNINHGNISALLNTYVLTEGQSTDLAKDIAGRVGAFEQELHGRIDVWGLSHHHGFVRHPVSFLEMGWSWAMTGKPGAAIHDFERAASLGGSGGYLQIALAVLYSHEGRSEESEQAYYSVLVQSPDNVTAILGLARLAMRQRRYDQSRAYLGRLLELGVPREIVDFELASLEILMGNLPPAVEALERLSSQYPDQLRAPAILALLALDQGDQDALTRHVKRLESARTRSAPIDLILALAAASRGAVEDARTHLEQALEFQPNHVQALEMLIRLHIASGRAEEAEQRVRQLFAVDPKNALANLALGSLQYVRGEYQLAESSFLVSIQHNPTSDALNSLAWVYMALARHEDAQKYAAKAVRANPRNALAWDTLGEASLVLGNLDVAERALLQASEIFPDSPRIQFHMAQLYATQGNLSQALNLVETLEKHGRNLPIDLYEDIARLRGQLQ